MQSIGGLSHPNIVRAYNAGSAGGVHFLVMEYVDGVSLQRYVGIGPPQGGPLGLGAACEIVRQAALGTATRPRTSVGASRHQAGQLDACPRRPRQNRSSKILDMGLAKFHYDHSCRAVPDRGDDRASDRLTQPGATMGTVDYMAPEQWENSASADIRADIYSLGCTLFFLLTGKPPYGEPTYDSSRKKLMAHAVAAIPSLLERCPDVPAELEEIYETMMAKSRQDRYATPAEVAEAVAEFADAGGVGRSRRRDAAARGVRGRGEYGRSRSRRDHSAASFDARSSAGSRSRAAVRKAAGRAGRSSAAT